MNLLNSAWYRTIVNLCKLQIEICSKNSVLLFYKTVSVGCTHIRLMGGGNFVVSLDDMCLLREYFNGYVLIYLFIEKDTFCFFTSVLPIFPALL